MMDEIGACCLPDAIGVTYIKIGVRQIAVGLRGLDVVFKQLTLLQRQPEAISDRELVDMTRKYNYIPESAEIEQEYAEALRNAFYVYLERLANDGER